MKLKVETKEVKADPEKGTPAGILIKLSGLTKQKNSEVLAGALQISWVIEKVGVFDIEFFLYWDDIDWCVRVKDAGWRVVAQPQIQALHKGGGANATNTLPRYYYWRNKLRFFAKHQVRYDPNQFKHFLKRSLVRNVTFQYLSQTTELLVAMQRGLYDAECYQWALSGG